ncbi:uncharacterized protein VTP21DRAFT_7454 [Calcarisporiella thermophila]|uniref:uncharacterized protein n=1 Tax=Calcarisporiella thermophila TaxID=911321 RepID=UPI003742BC5C
MVLAVPVSELNNSTWTGFYTEMAKSSDNNETSIKSSEWNCIQFNNPLNLRDRREWPCVALKRQELARRQQSSGNGKNDLFRIRFQCKGTPRQLCNKAERELNLAGQMLSASIRLTQPISVDAQFFSFEKSDDPNLKGFGGFAGPTRMLPMQDDDGVVRMFPQSLVRQMNVRNAQFARDDIEAKFNSDFPFRFLDEAADKSEKDDFLEVAMHELTHGLGFLSLWADGVASENFLTPELNVKINSDQTANINGFRESIFDRFMITLPEKEPMTKFTQQLNKFNGGRSFRSQSPEQFASVFGRSPQGRIAAKMMQKATGGRRGQGLAFKASKEAGGQQVLLETSLSPFRRGSSVSHVDKQSHLNTRDRLMRFSGDGLPFNQAIRRFGNPIGPELTAVLNTIGYTVEPASNQTIVNMLEKARSEVTGGRNRQDGNDNSNDTEEMVAGGIQTREILEGIELTFKARRVLVLTTKALKSTRVKEISIRITLALGKTEIAI